MRANAILLCVLVFLGLAACGSDKDESSKATTTTPTTPGPGPRARARDAATASKLVLVESDFPAGWTSAPSEQAESAEEDVTSDEFAACLGISGDGSETAHLEGNDFTMGDNQVGSQVDVITEETVYGKDVEAINSPKLETCVKAFLTRLLTEETGEAPASVAVADVEVPKHGDTSRGIRATAAGGPGGSLTVYADLVLMARNRAEVTATFVSPGAPIDPALEKSLLDKLGARLDAV